MKLSDESFEQVAAEAVESIPASFHVYLEDVAIDIEDMPDRATCERVGLQHPGSLLGIYQGTPMNRRHVNAPYRYPDRIVLYQKNIERICSTRDEVIKRIRQTVLHEVGHHFGLTEQQLRDLGYG
jgi:predicted Zn-dependent protease with MMP-like domain